MTAVLALLLWFAVGLVVGLIAGACIEWGKK